MKKRQLSQQFDNAGVRRWMVLLLSVYPGSFQKGAGTNFHRGQLMVRPVRWIEHSELSELSEPPIPRSPLALRFRRAGSNRTLELVRQAAYQATTNLP